MAVDSEEVFCKEAPVLGFFAFSGMCISDALLLRSSVLLSLDMTFELSMVLVVASSSLRMNSSALTLEKIKLQLKHLPANLGGSDFSSSGSLIFLSQTRKC